MRAPPPAPRAARPQIDKPKLCHPPCLHERLRDCLMAHAALDARVGQCCHDASGNAARRDPPCVRSRPMIHRITPAGNSIRRAASSRFGLGVRVSRSSRDLVHRPVQRSARVKNREGERTQSGRARHETANYLTNALRTPRSRPTMRAW